MESTKELTIAALLMGAKATTGDKRGRVMVQRADAVQAVGEGAKVLQGTDAKRSHVVVDLIPWIAALEKATKPTSKSATAKE